MKALGQCHGDRRRIESLSDPPPKVHPFPGPGSSRDQGGTRTDQSPLGSVLPVQRARRGGPWTNLSRPPGSGYERAVRSGARRCERRPPSEERGRSNARTVKPPCPPRRSHRFLPPGPNPFPPAESVRHAEIRSALGYDVPRARRLVVPQKFVRLRARRDRLQPSTAGLRGPGNHPAACEARAYGTPLTMLRGDALSDPGEVLTLARRGDEAAGLTAAATARLQPQGRRRLGAPRARRARLAALDQGRRRAGSRRYRPRRCAGLCAAGDARTLHSCEAKRGHIDHQPARSHLDRAPHRAQRSSPPTAMCGSAGRAFPASLPREYTVCSRAQSGATACRRLRWPGDRGILNITVHGFSTRCPYGSCRR
jgi:hypothetical protein